MNHDLKDPKGMSDAEIEGEISSLSNLRAAARARQVELTKEHDRRAAERTTDAIIAKLSPAEREVFLSKLQRVEPTPVAVGGIAPEIGQ